MLRVVNSERMTASIKVILVLLICVITFPSDWSCIALDKLYGIIQMGVIFSIPVIMMYNGQRGRSPKINKIMKWLFYIYYPLHLFIIGCIQYIR